MTPGARGDFHRKRYTIRHIVAFAEIWLQPKTLAAEILHPHLVLAEHSHPPGFWHNRTMNGSARERHEAENSFAPCNNSLTSYRRHSGGSSADWVAQRAAKVGALDRLTVTGVASHFGAQRPLSAAFAHLGPVLAE